MEFTKPLLLVVLSISLSGALSAGTGDTRSTDNVASDSIIPPPRFIHRIGIEGRPGYILPTNPFLEGENAQSRPINTTLSTHLKYSFQFNPASRLGQIYRGAY